MKALLLICAALLFLGTADLPIGYYTFLRFSVTIGSIAVVVTEFDNRINFWVLTFGVVAIMFNPILPVYLHSKSAWVPIDIVCGVLFIIKSLMVTKKQKSAGEK